MRESPRSANFVANRHLRSQFLARFMAAHTKNHKVTHRKAGRPRSNKHRTRSGKSAESPKRHLLREPAKQDQLPQDPEEPRPEDLAKEEPIKVEEVEQVTAAIDAEPIGPRARERGAYDGDTAIKLYLREIGQVKLLTPQEEIELAARIKKGDKKAREQMIKANLRLVVKIARDYEGIGLPLLDLISEGNIGLMKAVERFDPAKGGKLSTYGSWWIKQSIKRALANQSKTIRLPVHVAEKLSRIRKKSRQLTGVLGRNPTAGELSDELAMPAEKIAFLRAAASPPSSLDAPMNDSE